MAKPLVVGVAGRARSGKDTLASYLLAEVQRSTKIAFADALKEGVAVMLGMTRADMDHPNREKTIEEFGFSVRKALQVFGTEGGRTLHPDLWVNLLKLRVAKSDAYLVVIPDVRFQNEAVYVRENGVLLHVVRPDGERSVGIAGHQSELGLGVGDDDIVFHNDSTLEVFLQKALHAIPEVLTRARAKVSL